VYGKDLAKLMFSLPTEEVQNEIVAILDKFTALEAELEAELEARQVQYEALSRIMFSIASLTPIMTWGKLGEVVRIRNGSDWKNLPVGDIPVYGSGGVMQHVGKAVHEGPSVLIPRKGSLGNIFFSAGPFWTVDTCFYTEIDFAKVLPRFLFHYLRFMNLASLNLAGGVPSLTQSQLNNVAFPMIDIQRQTEIAKILDGIQDLIEDKQAGLVVELDARRRQYEYYRDQLLTFKEA
jgi:type I restriction enzyme S subunit